MYFYSSAKWVYEVLDKVAQRCPIIMCMYIIYIPIIIIGVRYQEGREVNNYVLLLAVFFYVAYYKLLSFPAWQRYLSTLWIGICLLLFFSLILSVLQFCMRMIIIFLLPIIFLLYRWFTVKSLYKSKFLIYFFNFNVYTNLLVPKTQYLPKPSLTGMVECRWS